MDFRFERGKDFYLYVLSVLHGSEIKTLRRTYEAHEYRIFTNILLCLNCIQTSSVAT